MQYLGIWKGWCHESSMYIDYNLLSILREAQSLLQVFYTQFLPLLWLVSLAIKHLEEKTQGC